VQVSRSTETLSAFKNQNGFSLFAAFI